MEIIRLTKHKKFYHFEKDKMLRFAVERCFEIIGIAATKISAETREQFKNIPWRSIIGLRNIIAHEYGEIKIEKIWDFSQSSIPNLMKALTEFEELKKYIKP